MGHHSKQPFEQNSNNFAHLARVPLTLEIINKLSGQQNVLTAHQIQMQLDINKNSIQNLGYLLPFLVELNITNSLLDSLRDLGTCLKNLKILRISNCRLENLDGATSFISLIELEARDNYIDDVYNCAFLQNLETLDIENNNIADINNLSFLSVCNNLQKLTIRYNPIAEATNYRDDVWCRVPNLKILDDVILTKQKVDKCTKNGNIILYKNANHTHENLNEKAPQEILEQKNETEETRKLEKELAQQKEKLKKKKLQRRPTLSDLLCKQGRIADFWPHVDNEPRFLRRRRTNSMVDEILFPLEYNNSKNDEQQLSVIPSTKRSNSLTKQNSMPDYPAWFDPYLKSDEDKSNKEKFEVNKNKPKTSMSPSEEEINGVKKSTPLNDIPSTYMFKSKSCLVVDNVEKEIELDTDKVKIKDEKIQEKSIVKLMSNMQFPKPVQKNNSLDFTDSE